MLNQDLSDVLSFFFRHRSKTQEVYIEKQEILFQYHEAQPQAGIQQETILFSANMEIAQQ